MNFEKVVGSWTLRFVMPMTCAYRSVAFPCNLEVLCKFLACNKTTYLPNGKKVTSVIVPDWGVSWATTVRWSMPYDAEITSEEIGQVVDTLTATPPCGAPHKSLKLEFICTLLQCMWLRVIRLIVVVVVELYDACCVCVLVVGESDTAAAANEDLHASLNKLCISMIGAALDSAVNEPLWYVTGVTRPSNTCSPPLLRSHTGRHLIGIW